MWQTSAGQRGDRRATSIVERQPGHDGEHEHESDDEHEREYEREHEHEHGGNDDYGFYFFQAGHRYAVCGGAAQCAVRVSVEREMLRPLFELQRAAVYRDGAAGDFM